MPVPEMGTLLRPFGVSASRSERLLWSKVVCNTVGRSYSNLLKFRRVPETIFRLSMPNHHHSALKKGLECPGCGLRSAWEREAWLEDLSHGTAVRNEPS